MGLCLPWRRLTQSSDPQAQIRVLTCNLERGNLTIELLNALVEETQPDLIALQETSAVPGLSIVSQRHYYTMTFRGLCLISRYPIDRVENVADRERGLRGAAIRVRLTTPAGPVQLVNVHLETPRQGIEAVIDTDTHQPSVLTAGIASRWHFSDVMSTWLDERQQEPLVVAGDFNMPTDSAIYRRYWSRYANAFSQAGWGYGYTKYTSWFGARIDHVLTDGALRCRRAWVGPDVGSDHRPVIADLEWVESAGPGGRSPE
jgi:endonuclease/exonuclease/phosphatase family metal-dependent hydrolase